MTLEVGVPCVGANAYGPKPCPITLIQRLARGDREALGDLYDRYAGLVNGLALRILRHAADAEDVVHTVFVQAWRQAAHYDGARGTPEAWLCTIARTRALDHLRKQASRREDPCGLTSEPQDTPAIVERLAVRQALGRLSTGQRRALELAYYDGLTQPEIATRLGAPLGTIKTRIRSAMRVLRETLESPPAARAQ